MFRSEGSNLTPQRFLKNNLVGVEEPFSSGTWTFIMQVLSTIAAWLAQVGTSLSWLSDAYLFLHKHLHFFHVLGWALFFGPIIILAPCLLLLELAILLLLNINFIFHGQLSSESIEDRFAGLKDYFLEWRENIFASVEEWTTLFNTWTSRYPPLLVLRLIGGAMSLCILFGIWRGW